jgi:hypothetical protein
MPTSWKVKKEKSMNHMSSILGLVIKGRMGELRKRRRKTLRFLKRMN